MTLSGVRQSTMGARALLAQNSTARDHVRGRRRGRCRTTATLAGAAWVVLALALGGCYRYPWRPAPDPLVAAAASAGTPLLVTTRALTNGAAHRYVLSSAGIEGDSLVGVVFEEYRRIKGGRWRMVSQAERERRVSVATADIAEVSRREREPDQVGTALLMISLVGALLGGWLAFVYVASAGC